MLMRHGGLTSRFLTVNANSEIRFAFVSAFWRMPFDLDLLVQQKSVSDFWPPRMDLGASKYDYDYVQSCF